MIIVKLHPQNSKFPEVKDLYYGVLKSSKYELLKTFIKY